ncbi:MAG: hypothetical protein ACKVWV_04385 [Planctomycetota bacterium]
MALASLRFALPSSVALVVAALASTARAQCPEQGPVQYWTGAGTTACPCFVPNEEFGTIFNTIPAAHFPIQITKIGFAWGSAITGQGQTLEDSLNVYGAGLPNPGSPIHSVAGPALTDGFLNEFNVTPLNWMVTAQPFTVTLRFANSTVNDPFAPTAVHDGNGCQAGKNVVKAVPGGWFNACALGVTGDWVSYIHYIPNSCGGGPVGTGFCFGDGSLATPCPCAPPNFVPSPSGGAGRGCANSFNLSGGLLAAAGSLSPDTVVFTGDIGPAYAGFGFLVKGNARSSIGIANGDGLRCVDGALIRFGGHNAGTNGAASGLWTYPNTAQTTAIATLTSQPAGQDAWYQLFYRNAAASFCSAGTTNWTNGVRLSWPP